MNQWKDRSQGIESRAEVRHMNLKELKSRGNTIGGTFESDER